MQSSAKIIDLDAYRKQKEGKATPRPAMAPLPCVPVFFSPVWGMMPLPFVVVAYSS